MRIILCGVRGSTPAPGAEFAAIGGHTSCVAIPAGERWLVLDAGTGLRRMAAVLDGAPLRGSILLTHLHWDHTQGLPFLPNADRADAEVAVHLPRQDGDEEPLTVLRRAMSPPHFPIGPDELDGRWTFESLDPGEHRIEGFHVRAAEVTHKGGTTYGYRIDDGDTSIAYLPDHAPAIADPGRHEAALDLARDADVLFHDSQFLEAERAMADDYGHATVADAIAFATEAAVSHLVLLHHSPARTDDQVRDAVRAEVGTPPFDVVVGHEGLELDLTRAGVAPPPPIHR